MSGKKKNILFITSDQQHWHTLGINNPQVKTPNLDRLAKMGTNFTRAYTVNPTCTPTRCSWLTGTMPSQHGAYSLGTKLMEDVHVIGDDLLKAGARSALVGKAHFQPLVSTEEYPSLEAYPVMQDLEFWKNYNDRFYGFDKVDLARNHTHEAHVGQHYAIWLEEQGCKNWRDYFVAPTGTKPDSWGVWDIPEEYHYDNWIAQRTNSYLEDYAKNGDQFYLWASFFDPHPQYLVPKPWADMYDPADIDVPAMLEGEHDKNPPHFKMTQEDKPDFSAWKEEEGHHMHGFGSHKHDRQTMAEQIAIYYGMISMMDHYIGKILDKLDELGLTEDTLVCFTTDHGHFYGHHGLNAKGAFHYEDMIKVPLIASLPGVIPAGKESANLQSLLDLAPTFLSFAGIDIPRCMTGQDRRPEWSGENQKPRKSIIVENRHQPTTLFLKTLVTDRYKMTVYYEREYGEIFDLQEDPGEYNNLWDSPEHKELKTELMQELIFAQMELEPLPMPRIGPA